MASSPFEALHRQLATGGVEATLEELADQLRAEQKYHELFDALLMRSRYCLGLPIILTTSLDDLPDPLRNQVEEAYLDACREVGALFLRRGQLREAWMYLRPVGDRTQMAQAMETIEPTDENLNDLIEIALHEGVAPPLGYRLVLEHYGTCNAITTFEGVIMGRSRADQQASAALLIRHLHRELTSNVRADIARQEGTAPREETLSTLVADRDWLFAENSYHIDTTHLASTVRFARLVEDRDVLRLALELTEYGRRLSRQFQFPGEEPFADVYPSHGLFFAALLGDRIDEAVQFFGDRAQVVDIEEHGSLAAEVYIALLARLQRFDEALEAAATLIPRGTRTSGFAPTLLGLSRLAGSYDRLMQLCQERSDLIGYTAGLVESSLQESSSTGAR